MSATLIFLALCALVISLPFIWRWRVKTRRRDAAIAADTETLMLEIAAHLNRRKP